MSDTRALAARLTATDDGVLRTLLLGAPTSVWRGDDFFELADALLEPDQIAHLLVRLPRDLLTALLAQPVPATAVPAVQSWIQDNPAEALVLGADDPAAGFREAVRSYLASDAAHVIRDRLAADEPRPVTDTAADERAASERAFHAVTALSEVFSLAERGVVPLTARGAVPITEAQRIAEIASTETLVVQFLIGLAQRLGYAQDVSGRLRITTRGDQWSGSPTSERWARLVSDWWQAQPAARVGTVADHPEALWDDELIALVRWRYPALDDASSNTAAAAGEAEALGLLDHGRPTPAATALFRSDATAVRAAAERTLPADVSIAYIQHDMTLITTGPLDAAADRCVHQFADTEHRSYAARFRIGESSLRRGLRSGLSVGEIRSFLVALSPVPLPQPLDYLLDSLTARGEPVTTPPIEPLSLAPPEDDPRLAATLSRLRSTESADSDATWRERQLKAAIRDKRTVLVAVRMPNGSLSEFALQPGSAASGRLRARDVRADVERTLPMALIESVTDLE